eukprot:TRINITY_DN64296_c0_g1_i1.p1 TRINITY_DN64296_c0_g1~~TRINITY_DN64296_c0_g1_i1.p1  ORF type:complete len:162 (+),score=37.60 TRINITY_DN64296_c0_g1_i1:82-567(+)
MCIRDRAHKAARKFRVKAAVATRSRSESMSTVSPGTSRSSSPCKQRSGPEVVLDVGQVQQRCDQLILDGLHYLSIKVDKFRIILLIKQWSLSSQRLKHIKTAQTKFMSRLNHRRAKKPSLPGTQARNDAPGGLEIENLAGMVVNTNQPSCLLYTSPSPRDS